MSVEGWEEKKLRDLAIINYGKSPSAILSSEGIYPVVGTGGAERLGTRYLYDGDSIILGRKGSIDRVYFATGKFWTIDTAYYLSEFNKAFPKWLFYFLQTIDLQSMNEATGVPSLSRNFLYEIEISKPPVEEQEKIAEILSTIDRAIEQTEAIIAKQQGIKTGLMQDLLTKGIDENGNIRSEETHEFKDSAIGRIPVEWEVKDLREVSLIIDPNPSHRYPPPSDIGIPIASTENFVGENEFDLSFAEKVPFSVFEQQNQRCSFSETDVVFARKGRLGLARSYGKSKKVFSHTVVIFKPRDSEQIDPCYILWLVRFHDFFKQIEKRMNSNSGVPTLGVEFLGAVPIRVPKLDEQIKICSVLNHIEMSVEDSQRNLSKQKLQKAGLMQDLLTGKVRVTPLLAHISA